jgi:hypothetical protein
MFFQGIEIWARVEGKRGRRGTLFEETYGGVDRVQ